MVLHKKMILLGVTLILIALGVFLFSRIVLSRPNPPLPQTTVRIGEVDFTVELATSTLAQARGLSGRVSLADGTGMLFVFDRPGIQNFWMKDMNFPIDIIWIGKGKVIGFVERAAQPAPHTPLWSLPVYTSPDGVDTVLEVPSGTVARDHIQEQSSVFLINR